MNVIVGLGYSPNGAARGLLGNGNGKPDDDLIGREGKALALPLTFADLYGVYGEGVRVNPRDSLFGDEKGAVFTPPAKPFYAADLDGALYQKARATCTAAGIKHEALLDACTLDVAVLGSDAATKSFAGAPPPAKVMQPGQHPRAQPGCGCAVTSTGDAGLVTLVAAALWLAWRRRRAAPAR
jgi:MYXO-CTERM domain-containing protein